MLAIGNFFLLISTILLLCLVNLIFGQHAKTGDAGVGFSFMLLLTLVGLILCLFILTTTGYLSGGLDWLHSNKSVRLVIVIIGFLSVSYGIIFLTPGVGLTQNSGSSMHTLWRILIITNYLAILAGTFFFINQNLREAIPVLLWKLPINFPVLVGLISFVIHIGSVSASRSDLYSSVTEKRAAEKVQKQLEIEMADLSGGFLTILHYTGQYQDPTLRKLAVERIRSQEGWEETLIRHLTGDRVSDAFVFLASNEVDNKEKFIEPMKIGISKEAERFRSEIKNCYSAYDLYAGRFSLDIERILDAMDKTKVNQKEFLPSLKELRTALYEPRDFEIPKLKAADILDRRIRKLER